MYKPTDLLKRTKTQPNLQGDSINKRLNKHLQDKTGLAKTVMMVSSQHMYIRQKLCKYLILSLILQASSHERTLAHKHCSGGR